MPKKESRLALNGEGRSKVLMEKLKESWIS